MGLLLCWLDVVTIAICFSFGWTFNLLLLVDNFIIIFFNRLLFQAGQTMNTSTAASCQR
jgi:hypothetical protein